MVAFVSGASQGLSLSSLATLGQHGLLGSAARGRSGEAAFVNVASGNLTLQASDERLMGSGLAANTLRTYNSQGSFSGDNWAQGVELKRVQRVGTLGQPGSQLLRTDEDGAVATYAFDAATGLYRSTEGAGAHDTLGYDTAADQYVWTDGSSGRTERYGSGGRLQSSSDASGNTLSYAYHADGRLQSVSTAGGETTTFVYDGTLLVELRTTYQEEGATRQLTRTRYGYDAQQRLQAVTVDLSPEDGSVADGKVYVTTYTYDGSSNRVASVAQTDGTALQLEYVQAGGEYRIWKVTDALNHVTEFSYDLANRRTAVTDPMGAVTVYEYDAAGRLAKVTAPSVPGGAPSSQFFYDADGNVERVLDGEGRVLGFTYDANGNQLQQTDGAGNRITRTYDAHNQLQTETVHLASATQTVRYVHDAQRRLRFEISAAGGVTEHRYNTLGQRERTLGYAGFYDLGGLADDAVPTEAQLAAWAGTQDLTRSTRADMHYDVRGALDIVTTYDAVLASGEGTGARETRYVYDQAGQLRSVRQPGNANAATFVYDGLGRLRVSTDALQRSTLTEYDDAGNRTTVTAANGLISTSAFDRAGRLMSLTQASAPSVPLGTTLYFHDANGRLRMTRDATGQRSHMLHDAAGRKTADIDADGSVVRYHYNAAGQLTRTRAYAQHVDVSLLVDAAGGGALQSVSFVGSTVGDAMIRAAIGNATSQGGAVATGMQEDFKWRNVAVSAAAAGAGQWASESLGLHQGALRTDADGQAMTPAGRALQETFGRGFGSNLAANALRGFASAATAAAVRGGKVEASQITVDVFGNALGDSLAAESSRGSQQEDALGQFIGEQLQAQDRRDFYSLASAPNASYVRFGGSPDKAVQEWSDDVDAMIRNSGSNRERRDAYLAASTADASDAIKRQLQRLDGTVRGAAQWVYNGASFLNDQGWAAANAVSGGWLAENNDAARAAVERNAALGRGLLSLPEKASVTALRALTGNLTSDEVGQGVSRALRTEEIAALEARGDYSAAQAIRTENALNIASFAVGAAPAARSAFSFAGATGETALLGSRLAVEDFAASSTGQRLALQMERFNYELGVGGSYVVEPKFSLGSTSQALEAARNRLGQLALIEPDVTRNLVEMASANGGQMLGLE
jgi:YD repeat-containing protein